MRERSMRGGSSRLVRLTSWGGLVAAAVVLTLGVGTIASGVGAVLAVVRGDLD